jgi:hypothetical protein
LQSAATQGEDGQVSVISDLAKLAEFIELAACIMPLGGLSRVQKAVGFPLGPVAALAKQKMKLVPVAGALASHSISWSWSPEVDG